MPTPVFSNTDTKFHSQGDVKVAVAPIKTAAGTAGVLYCPFGAEILAAYFAANATTVAGTANFYSVALQDGGTDLLGTTVLGTAVGGTAGVLSGTAYALPLAASPVIGGGKWITAVTAITGSPTVGGVVVIEYVNRDI